MSVWNLLLAQKMSLTRECYLNFEQALVVEQPVSALADIYLIAISAFGILFIFPV